MCSDFHTNEGRPITGSRRWLCLGGVFVCDEGDIDSLDVCALDKQDLHDEMARLEIQLGLRSMVAPLSYGATCKRVTLTPRSTKKSVDDVLQTRWLIRYQHNH